MYIILHTIRTSTLKYTITIKHVQNWFKIPTLETQKHQNAGIHEKNYTMQLCYNVFFKFKFIIKSKVILLG